MLYTLVKAVLRKYALYTLACENANSKLVEVATVADVYDEDRIGNSLLQIWKMRFGL